MRSARIASGCWASRSAPLRRSPRPPTPRCGRSWRGSPLHALASEAGARRVPSWDPRYDPLKLELGSRIAPARRALFETFAPTTGTTPDRALAEALIGAIVASIREVDPLLDPTERLHSVRLPVRLMHGRGDALIPFTETLRMERALRAGGSDVRATVTRLFAHTKEDDVPGTLSRGWEGGRFVRALGEALRLVESG